MSTEHQMESLRQFHTRTAGLDRLVMGTPLPRNGVESLGSDPPPRGEISVGRGGGGSSSSTQQHCPAEEPDERGVINKNQSEIDVKFTKMGLTRYTGDGYHNTDVTCPEICRV